MPATMARPRKEPISNNMATANRPHRIPRIPLDEGRPVRNITLGFAVLLALVIIGVLIIPLPPAVYAILAIAITILATLYAVTAVHLAHTAPRR